MRKLTIGKEKFNVPESFEECTVSQISGILTAQIVLDSARVENINNKIEKVKLSILFCLIPDLSMAGWKMLNSWQKATVMNLVRWAFKARVEMKPFEFIIFENTKYYLPAAGYADTSAIEWALLNIYYLAYTKGGQKDFFFKIVALICRPERADIVDFRANSKTWSGDVREHFNFTLAEERVSVFKKMPFGALISVFQYWEKMNADFVTRNDKLFNSGDSKPMFQNGEGCLSMLEDVAEEGTIGDLEKVYDTNVANLFVYLRHKQKKVERREEEMLKNQRDDSR